MLYRVSGKLADARSIGGKVDAPNAAAALNALLGGLKEQKISAESITEIRVRPMSATAKITVGKAPEKKK
jgi:hypothetical protein